ncbi:MAG TPA: LEA type 2 family protein [Thermoanaerobaculia bacterium]|nr:LEA type 2 family protein [Thermoanaerobaculia bacterium]
MRARALLPIVALAALGAALAGCASLGRLEPPEVDLVDLRLRDVGLLETSLGLSLRIFNPNRWALPVAAASYELFLGGVRVGRGTTDAGFEVPRLGSETVELTIGLDNLALLRQVRPILDAGRFDYRIEATHYLGGRWNRRGVESVHQGQLDLRRR